MARVKRGSIARARRKKILKEAKGYFGSKHRLYKTAKEQLLKSGVYAYRDRKTKKREFRKLWITRINAACREHDISYSKFINGLLKAEVSINRKMISELAISDPKAFKELVEISKDALKGKKYTPKKVEIKEENKPELKKTVSKTTVDKKTSSKSPKATAVKKEENKPELKKTVSKTTVGKKTLSNK